MQCSACPSTKVFAGGLCSGCYSRKRRRGTTERKNVVNSGSCIHDGCNRQSFAKNLCATHYQRTQHPLRTLWKNLRSRAAEGYPEAWDRFDMFIAEIGPRPSNHHQLRRPDPTKAWARGNCVWQTPVAHRPSVGAKEYARRWDLRKKYGLTLEQVEAMAKAQGGRCATCPAVLGENGAKVCVDHDHVTRKVRGLLCDPYNKALGLMQDSPLRLRAAAAYLGKLWRNPTFWLIRSTGWRLSFWRSSFSPIFAIRPGSCSMGCRAGLGRSGAMWRRGQEHSPTFPASLAGALTAFLSGLRPVGEPFVRCGPFRWVAPTRKDGGQRAHRCGGVDELGLSRQRELAAPQVGSRPTRATVTVSSNLTDAASFLDLSDVRA